MGLKIEYRDSQGRRVTPEQWVKGLGDTARQHAKDGLGERIRAVTCPVHGSAPETVGTQETPTGWQYVVGGCCDELQNAVAKIVRGR